MANFIKDISNSINNTLKKRFVGDLKKDTIRDLIDQSIKEHDMFVLHLNMLSTENKKKFGELIMAMAKDKSKKYVSLYTAYKGKLRDVANTAESDVFLSSIIDANVKASVILTDLLTNIDEVFKKDNIVIKNTKMSHIVIFGVLQESLLLSEFSFYLFNGLICDLTDELNTPPKYRKIYLQDNVQLIANIVNRLYTNTGADSYMACINNMKKDNTNLLLVNDNNESNIGFLKANSFNINTKNLITSGFVGKNLFRWFGEVLVNWTHDKYKKIEQEKSWMEAQVALLKLDLDNVSPDDKQYRSMVKVIESYDALIAKADKKLNSYYND